MSTWRSGYSKEAVPGVCIHRPSQAGREGTRSRARAFGVLRPFGEEEPGNPPGDRPGFRAMGHGTGRPHPPVIVLGLTGLKS